MKTKIAVMLLLFSCVMLSQAVDKSPPNKATTHECVQAVSQDVQASCGVVTFPCVACHSTVCSDISYVTTTAFTQIAVKDEDSGTKEKIMQRDVGWCSSTTNSIYNISDPVPVSNRLCETLRC